MTRILYEIGDFFVMMCSKSGDYEVYQNGITHATRRGVVGFSLGLDRAKLAADRCHNEQKAQKGQVK